MARIAVGGLQHETNTFAPWKADYKAFEKGGGWPGIDSATPFCRGGRREHPRPRERSGARRARPPAHGLAWASASPSAHVTRDAFERIAGEMVGRLGAAGPVDGVYLDLHGAMVAEHDDGEGELLASGARIVGEPRADCREPRPARERDPGDVRDADAMVAYRTYPHVDMAETGARAARLLERCSDAGRPFAHAIAGSTF